MRCKVSNRVKSLNIIFNKLIINIEDNNLNKYLTLISMKRKPCSNIKKRY